MSGEMSIIDVLAAASKSAVQLEANCDESRFPIVVRGETRAFLESQAAALGMSLAGLCGVILNEVTAESKRRKSNL